MSLAKCENYELCNDLCKYLNDNLKKRDQQIKIDIKNEERFPYAKLIIYSNDQELYRIIPLANNEQNRFFASTNIIHPGSIEGKSLDDFKANILKYINRDIKRKKQHKQQNNLKSYKDRHLSEKIALVLQNIPVSIWSLGTRFVCNKKKDIITKETVNNANKVVPFK